MDGYIASKMDSNHLDNKKSNQSYQPAVGFLNKKTIPMQAILFINID